MEILEIETPHFSEDPTVYEDDLCVYLDMLERYNPTACSSARKPSLSDYDAHYDSDDDEDWDGEVKRFTEQ